MVLVYSSWFVQLRDELVLCVFRVVHVWIELDVTRIHAIEKMVQFKKLQ
jgi:hypothetical protein